MYEQETDNCILVLRNIPKGYEIGIDYHSWYTGDKFQGISNIPPGFHFVFIRITDKYGEMSCRNGFFVYLNPGDVVSRCFKEVDEEFEQSESFLSDEDLHGLLKYLAPYPYTECKLWKPLTKHVTSSVLDRLQPISKKISSYTEVCLPSNTKQTGSGRMNRLLMKSDCRTPQTVSTQSDDSINFTKIPVLSTGTPGELTMQNLDTTEHLLQLIENISEGEDGLLGEFEFAFISFLIGQAQTPPKLQPLYTELYDAFEHWKQILSLVCGCLEAPLKKSSFYELFIDTVCMQLDEIPEDFFLQINPQKNVIFILFQDFFQNLAENHGLSQSILRKSSYLREKLFRQFQWEFEDVLEDEMPAILEL